MTRGEMEDRQVSLKQMLDTVDKMPVMKDNNGMEFIEKSLVKTRIWLLPSAEPDRKTGRWAYKTTDAYIQRTCSACGWSERMYHRNYNQDGLIRNYCPNCGIKMRGITREEAIQYLQKLYLMADITDEYGDMDDTEPYETAIDIAIKALEEQESPCDVCVCMNCGKLARGAIGEQ